MNYAPRLTFPFATLSSWISRVAMVSEKIIFYEHADNPSNVHVHGLIMGCTVDVKTLKNWVKEAVRVTPTRNQWSFKQEFNGESVNEGFIKYMSKGKLDPKYVKGFEPEFIAQEKSKGYDGKSERKQKQSPAAEYYDGFVKWLHEKSNHETMPDISSYDGVRKYAWRYMMLNSVMPMPHQMSLYKASLVRYCWDYSLPLPDKVEKQLGI